MTLRPTWATLDPVTQNQNKEEKGVGVEKEGDKEKKIEKIKINRKSTQNLLHNI